MHVVWAARWEHDKNPQDFFKAIRIVLSQGIPIRISVVGEQFTSVPPVFAEAKVELAACIEHFGYQSRSAYEALLSSADVIVSTANHEFFGISVLEAVAAGCVPLLPRRLVYPELFAGQKAFYDGSPEDLAQQLSVLATRHQQGLLDTTHSIDQVKRFGWDRAVSALDQAALNVCAERSPTL
jgi:glycosyltransferase involved in cell wall biosynthesis